MPDDIFEADIEHDGVSFSIIYSAEDKYFQILRHEDDRFLYGIECRVLPKEDGDLMILSDPEKDSSAPIVSVVDEDENPIALYKRREPTWEIEGDASCTTDKDAVSLVMDIFKEHIYTQLPDRYIEKALAPTENPRYQELLTQHKALSAEYDGLKGRLESEKQRDIQSAENSMLGPLFEGYDGLERILANLSSQDMDSQRKEVFAEGIRLEMSKYLNSLKMKGIVPIPSVGETFNPEYHMGVTMQASDEPKGTIILEFKKGFMRDGKVIRESQVVVSAGKPTDDL